MSSNSASLGSPNFTKYPRVVYPAINIPPLLSPHPEYNNSNYIQSQKSKSPFYPNAKKPLNNYCVPHLNNFGNERTVSPSTRSTVSPMQPHEQNQQTCTQYTANNNFPFVQSTQQIMPLIPLPDIKKDNSFHNSFKFYPKSNNYGNYNSKPYICTQQRNSCLHSCFNSQSLYKSKKSNTKRKLKKGQMSDDEETCESSLSPILSPKKMKKNYSGKKKKSKTANQCEKDIINISDESVCEAEDERPPVCIQDIIKDVNAKPTNDQNFGKKKTTAVAKLDPEKQHKLKNVIKKVIRVGNCGDSGKIYELMDLLLLDCRNNNDAILNKIYYTVKNVESNSTSTQK